MLIKVHGESFEVSYEVAGLIRSGAKEVKVQLKGGKLKVHTCGTTLSVLSAGPGFAECMISKMGRLFYFPFENGSVVSDGLSSGESHHRNHDGELRLNDYRGRGSIYHLLPLFDGHPGWVQVGRYDLANETEEVDWADEEAAMTITTEPGIVGDILRNINF